MRKIAIFASGNGSNFEVLADACREGRIPARVCALVCDRPGAYVLSRAAKFEGVEIIQLSPRDFASRADYESAVLERLRPLGIDLICLAGYMRIIGGTLLKAYPERIVNIHPSLLPSFKGAHAIRDAFDFGVKVYGVTIHYVDESLDGGRIIAQGAVPYEGTDIDALERLIHREEHRLYPATVARLLS